MTNAPNSLLHYAKNEYGNAGWTAPYGTLYLHDKPYFCVMEQNKDHYTIKIASVGEVIHYLFDIEPKGFFSGHGISGKPLEGNITLEGGNLFLLFGVFFLLQHVLDIQDQD